tara:strand:+ start:415810 stop:416541 length:732 start_codon:yes stop_codon:yes gene_type:complete
MNTKKHPSTDKLQKSSMLFLQLGLVLALFFVYGALELETVKQTPASPQAVVHTTEPLLVSDEFFTIERKVKTVPKPQQKVAEIFIVKPDDTPIPTILPDPIPNKPNLEKLINDLPGGDTLDNEPIDELPFITVEDAPIFPGCEGLDKAASKKCFTKQITQFVNRKFDTSLAEGLNLQGKQKIWVQFKIDKTGAVVDIQARAPHKNLEKEAVRIIEKLPLMTPGMQRKRPVGVKYTLPILFQVH